MCAYLSNTELQSQRKAACGEGDLSSEVLPLLCADKETVSDSNRPVMF